MPAKKSATASGRPEQTTLATMNAKQRARAAELCNMLPVIQHELFTLGLVITSANMAKTIAKLGYELCVADIKAGRVTPEYARYEAHVLERDGAAALAKLRAEGLRGAEKMLYGANA